MDRIQKNKHTTSFIHSPLALILYGLAIVYLSYLVIQIAGKGKEAKENRAIAARELALLEERKESLVADIEMLETDEGVEEAIREKYRVVKEGEGMVVIVDEPEEETGEKEKKGGFWEFLRGMGRRE